MLVWVVVTSAMGVLWVVSALVFVGVVMAVTGGSSRDIGGCLLSGRSVIMLWVLLSVSLRVINVPLK